MEKPNFWDWYFTYSGGKAEEKNGYTLDSKTGRCYQYGKYEGTEETEGGKILTFSVLTAALIILTYVSINFISLPFKPYPIFAVIALFVFMLERFLAYRKVEFVPAERDEELIVWTKAAQKKNKRFQIIFIVAMAILWVVLIIVEIQKLIALGIWPLE